LNLFGGDAIEQSELAEADGQSRTWSLRREWSKSFTIMLLLLLLAAITTLIGVRGVVGELRGTARQLNRESQTTAVLRAELVEHEETAHKLLSNEPVNRSAFVQQQQEISRRFTAAEAVFPQSHGLRAIVVATAKSWQTGLTSYGLWGNQVQALNGNHAAENPTFGASSDATDALLDGLEGPSLDAMNQGLAHDTDLERVLIGVLVGLFGLALAATVYFRRRMARDLLRPVASMHQGVLKLRAGDYDYRIEIARRDELGELADAFNGMAVALRDSHDALTLRATHDSLTGLPNRVSLNDRLARSFGSGADRRAGHESVLFIDIDDFKDVNDSLGHEGGDALLLQLATRLKNCVRPTDLVARLGGDEFAIVVVEDDLVATSIEVAERILDSLHVPFIIGDTRLEVAVSIGIAQHRPETVDAAELLRHADFAMYMAKGGGKGRYQLFDAQMHDNMVSRSALKTDLALAVAANELRLDYQPVANLDTGEVLGVEALVRWQHPTLGLLAPAEFIALAEESGDIDAIGCWVLDTATRQVEGWRRTIEGCGDLWLSVNLSALQLGNPSSLAAIHQILDNPAAHADKVVLEVTETALAADVDGAVASLNALKAFGVRIAIDDFGTGFSSLSTLSLLPVDIIKIDRAFVSGQATALPSVPMLEGILGLAAKLSLAVVAEGIEDLDQLNILRGLGCRMGQGYLLARPAPAEDISALLQSRRLLPLVVVPLVGR
jgi:diguanylate cyclase (GGDEF)-like protein